MARTTDQDIDLLRALEIFVIVAEHGSMTAAGSLLGMTQSAISQQIQNLEASIGASLFDRDLRPLRLTAAGSMLFERARALLAEAKDLRASVRGALGVGLPRLRLGVLSSVAGSLVAPVVFDLLDRHVAKSVTVWSGFGSDHQRSLANRELDLILIADPLFAVAGLERHELYTEPFVLLVPASYVPDTTDVASIASRLPLIRHSLRSPVGVQVEQYLGRLRIEAPAYVEFDSIESIVEAVAKGRGFAITTPTLLVQGVREGHAVQVHPLRAPAPTRSFALIARAGELGTLPAEIARTARAALRDVVLPRVRAIAPFAEALIEFPPGPGTRPGQ